MYCELTGEDLDKKKEISDKPKSVIVADNDTYLVEDVHVLKNLTMSRTILHRGKSTKGHVHPNVDIEEWYIFLSGVGKIELDGRFEDVKYGDTVAIRGDQFHRVHNTGAMDLVFISVFNPYDRS